MNKFFKRLALLLAVLMIVSMMPVQLFADNSVTSEEQSNGTGENSYLTISGIAGFADRKFASFAEAYTAIKPVLEGLCEKDALGQGVATADAFDALFTNRDEKGNATLTYTISGNIVYDETGYANLLTMGRRASHYGNDRHLINFKFVGATGKEADTLTVNSNITLPYEWWGEKTVTSISFENLTITGSAPSGLYPSQPYFEGINFKVDNCNLKGIKIYNCSNVKGTYTITNSTLDGTGTSAEAYAIHLQGNVEEPLTKPLTINISGNTIRGYDRGINIDQKTANATISGNTISIKEVGRSCIQLSRLANVAISNNTLELTGGNAITLHELLLGMPTVPKITVEGNTITGNGYLIYDDALANKKAFTSENLTLTIGTNTVASTVDTTQGVKGSTKFGLSETVDTVVKEALKPVATVNGVGYASLADAIAAAQNGDTIYVSAGEYTAYGNTSPKKSLTFVGAGAGNTIWTIGDLSKNVGGEGNGDYSFDGCDTITFKNMTLKSDGKDYRGFIRINNTVVENCTLEGKTAYWGYNTATFAGCTFNAPEGDYALWDYSTKTMTFDGCKFNISGKGVNVYVEAGNAGSEARKVEAKDCTINSTKANKAFLNIKNSTQAYEVTLSGDNKVNGLDANSTTGSSLYQVETTEVTETSGKTVKVQEKATDGTLTTVYEVKAASTAVAMVGGVEYTSLAEAIAAAKRNNTVKLLADTKENVTISTRGVTLDLNGFTLNGSTGERKPALTITERYVTIKDSSEAQTGTIMREDTAENSGVSSHYVIDIQGNAFVTFESGNVKNDSGAGGTKGASLVRIGTDDQPTWKPQLTIKGGTFTQDNFIVLKVGGYGTLYVNGGTINSKNSYAVENWSFAVIKDQAVVNGKVSSWTYKNSLKKNELEIRGGTVNGDVESVSYDGAEGKLAKVAITGGTVNGTLSTKRYSSATEPSKEMATIEITGGTFTKDPSKYVVEGSAITDNGDGTFGVAKAYLAEVDGNKYYTMDEAFHAAVAAGSTLKLLRNYTTASSQNSGSKSFTIDLNGFTWTYTSTDFDCAAFEINYPNVTLTVKNGTVVSASMAGLIPSAMSGTITYDNSGLVFDGVEITANGNSGIETNGNNTNDTVTLKNSTLNVPNGFGIYFPSSGTLTLDNSTVNAKTMGVQVCAGSLSINEGSAVTVTGNAVPKAENDGAIQDGAAISIVNRTGYKGLGTVTVSGGKFTAKEGNSAIKAYDWVNNTESDFTASEKVAVSGGTFSSEVKEDLCAEGFIPTKNADDTYGVKAMSVAKIGTVEYATLDAAIAAAKDGDTVTLLADINTPEKTYEITKSLTIDLNGKTVTGSGYDGVFEVTGKNINVVLNATNGGKVIAVENSGSAGKYAMAVWMCGDDSTLTINGGEFIQNITSTNDKQMDMIYASAGTIIINSGSFTSGTPKWTLNINDSAYKTGTANIIVNGGTFTGYDPRNAENEGKGTSLVADGVGIDKNADGTFTAKSGMAAQIVDADGNSVAAYATLEEAIVAANAGETVKLLADVTADVAINKNITLDLGGKTLTNTGAGKATISIANGATATVKNGNVIGGASYYNIGVGTEVNSTANLTLEDVTATAGNTDSSMIDNYGTLTIKSGTYTGGLNVVKSEEGSTLTINGGKFELNYAVSNNYNGVILSAGTTMITGGEFIQNATTPRWGNPQVVWAQQVDGYISKIEITGGTFTNKKSGSNIFHGYGQATSDNFEVSGGTFNKSVSQSYFTNGYECVKKADGTYGVQEATKGSKNYPYTLAELSVMTRDEYIAAQKALGGTMYVEIGDYSYDKNGVLGNGVRNDTPGQTEDRFVLNGYNSNGYLGEKNDGANGKNIIFVGGSVTSGVTGYASIDNIGTSLLLAVPAYTNVTFEGTTFNNVMSFDYQLYTGPWSQLGKLKFDNCKFNGLIVGAIASQTLTFNKCTFTNYINTISANNSNPTWIRPAYGNWSKGDNEGQGSDFKSLTTINFTNNTVTSTRPVKFERIAQWEMDTKVSVKNNKVTISAQEGDTSTKSVGFYFGANAKFDLTLDGNKKLGATSALYTAVYKAPNGTDYAGLPAGSTVKDSNGADVEVAGVIWKTTDALTLKTTTEAVEVAGVKFATLEEAFAAAKNGDTITLLSDVEMTEIIRVTDSKKITLALNGFNVTITATGKFIRVCNAELTITGNGTIKERNPYFAPIIIKGGAEGSENYSVVNIKEGVTLEGWAGVMIDQTLGTANNYGMVLNVEGATLNGVNDTDGASGSGIYVNGVVEDAKITLTDTTVTGTGTGMYLAGNADTTINGGSVKGDATGIEIRAGKLTLNNCDVTGGNGEVTADANGNGTTVTNAALAISQHTTKKPIEVIINGGTFNGTAAVYQTDVQGTGSADVKIAVKSGTFNGTISGETDGAIVISGGKFKVKVDDKYFDNDHACSTDKTGDYYTVTGHPITNMGLSIGESLTLRITVDESYKNGKLKYTYIGAKDGKVHSGIVYRAEKDKKGNWVFRISDINAQRADVIYTVQYVDESEKEVGSAKEVSILKYCEGLVEQYKNADEAVKNSVNTLVCKLLNYSAAAMDYRQGTDKDDRYNNMTWGERATALRKRAVELCGTVTDYAFEVSHEIRDYGYDDNAVGANGEKKVGIEFSDKIRLFFNINYNENYTYTYNGLKCIPEEVSSASTTHRIYVTVAPFAYDSEHCIEISDADGFVYEIAYSLDNVLETIFEKNSGTATGNLAKATYEYCRALTDFAKYFK